MSELMSELALESPQGQRISRRPWWAGEAGGVAVVLSLCRPSGCFRSGEGAAVRSLSGAASLSTPFDSLETAWPFIRRTIKALLRHGCQVIEVEAGA